MSEPATSVPIPAATLIIMRDRADAPPDILMVERSSAMAFAAGALVFPGGRIDPADHALAAIITPAGADSDDIAARIAAIRETIEEAGIAPGVVGLDKVGQVAAVRAALHGGATLAAALAGVGAAIDLAALVPFARWCPRHLHARIFDTRFYLAAAPEAGPAAQVDATENVRVLWTGARAVLDDAAQDRVRVIFPTRRNLERLAGFTRHADAVASAHAHPVRSISPWIETRDGERFLHIPDDAGYPVTFESLDTASRE